MLPPVAFILGYGQRVGHEVGKRLVKNGYKVALGSRSGGKDAKHEVDFFHLELDVTKTESIDAGFKTVTEKLGTPNVVIFNGTPLPLSQPAEADAIFRD